MRIFFQWEFDHLEGHCGSSPRPPALRPVLDDADWKWEVWRPRLASIVSRCLGDEQRWQTRHWLGLTLRPGGEKRAFLLLFFFSSSISKREPFLYERPLLSSLLSLPLVLLCCSPSSSVLFFTFLFTCPYWLPRFFFILRLKPVDFSFFCLPLSLSLSLRNRPVNLLLHITPSKVYFCPLSLKATLVVIVIVSANTECN